MRSQYDFFGGVVGKYSSKTAWEWWVSEVLHELFMYDLMFESRCSVLFEDNNSAINCQS